MEYSFSQTFGKGAIVFQNSPPPSLCSNSLSNSKSRSRSRSRSFEVHHEKSPFNEKDHNKYKISQNEFINLTNKQKPALKRQIRSYSQIPKCYDSGIHKQRQMQMQAKIKNVDGINERMVNLIKQLKQDCSKKNLNTQQFEKKQNFGIDIQRVKDLGYKYSEKNYKQKPLYRAQSSKIVKFQTSSLKNPNNVLSECLITSNKIKYNEYNQKQYYKSKVDKKFDFKPNNLLDQKENKKDKKEKDYYFFKDKDSVKYENNNEIYKRLNSLKGKIYTSEMYQSNGKKLNEKNKLISGSCQQDYMRGRNSKQFQFSRQKEIKKESNWLKNKVKTIQSQVQTNCFEFEDWDNKSRDQIQEISVVENQNFQIKQRSKEQQQSICMALYEADDYPNTKKSVPVFLNKKIKFVNQVQSKQSSNFNSNYNGESNRSVGLEQKLQRISQKIQNYQRKVQAFSLSTQNYNQKVRFESKRKNFSQNKQHFIFENSNGKNQKQQYPKRKTHQRLYTPTWGYEFNNIRQQNKEQNKISCQFYENKLSEQKNNGNFNKNKNTYMDENQESQKNNKVQNKEFQNKKNVGYKYSQSSCNLKERMNIKLGLSSESQRLSKQVELDFEFRKAKKQFSKLPQQFQGIDKSKWMYLLLSLKSQAANFPQVATIKQIDEIKQIFDLTDEEADPFYSISVQNLRDYQQVIDQTAFAYLSAEQYFKQAIMNKFNKETIEQIFSKNSDLSQQRIKLDQFTVSLSNALKSNYKCRDIYLLYRRLQKAANSQASNTISLQNLIYILSFEESDKRKTLRFIDNSSNVQPIKSNQMIENLNTLKKSKDLKKSLPDKYLKNKQNSHWKLQ